MILLFLCLLTFQCPAHAKSTRTVHLADGDMEPIYVEPGFSTIIKFDSHPEPGLIGDQDGFKVEYMKNLVAVKPLISKGRTNLFLFTKEGQFNFQLIASRGKHDNVVYVLSRQDRDASDVSKNKVVSLGEMLTKRLNQSVLSGPIKLSLESIAMPTSQRTLVLKFLIQEKVTDHAASSIDPSAFSILQGAKSIKIENIYLETRQNVAAVNKTLGLILIRADELKKGENLKLRFAPQTRQGEQKREMQVSFSSSAKKN